MNLSELERSLRKAMWLNHEEIQVSTPVRLNMKDDETPKFRTYLNQKRRKIETVIGQ